MGSQIRRLGKRVGKTARIGSRVLQKGLRIGSRLGHIGAVAAAASGHPEVAAALTAGSVGAEHAHAALHDAHRAVKSELEKK